MRITGQLIIRLIVIAMILQAIDIKLSATAKSVGLNINQENSSLNWQISTLDTSLDVGKQTSLDIDSKGNPHISYFDAIHKSIKYAYRTGSSTWIVQTVYIVGDSSPDEGDKTSLVIDINDYPHISFTSRSSGIELIYAHFTGTYWDIQKVDASPHGSSLALDNNGNPHISSMRSNFDPINGYTGSIDYSYRIGDVWQTRTVDSGSFLVMDTSLALDSNNNPQIGYTTLLSDQNEYLLKYAYWVGDSFDIETIDSGKSGLHLSLDLDRNGFPHMSYHNAEDDDLKYVYWAGSRWVRKTIDDYYDVGKYPSLNLDSNDYPHISYYDVTNGNLKYAYFDGQIWRLQTVDKTGNVGLYSSMAFGSDQYVYISYYDATNGYLKFAEADLVTYSVSGQVTDLSNTPIMGVTISDGMGHNAYTNSNGNYTLSGLSAGTYTITPTLNDYIFSPNFVVDIEVPPDATDVDFSAIPIPEPFLDLPFKYIPYNQQGAFLARTNSVFDHDLPNNLTNQRMLPYLGYDTISYPAQKFPCGPPNYKCYDGHNGYDFTQSYTGEPVLAAASGIIDDVNTGCDFCLGCQVTIIHGNGFKTIYGHLREKPTVTGFVAQGSPIGVIGDTSNPPCDSRGSHLHFELQIGDNIRFDPSGWFDDNDDPWSLQPNGNTSIPLWRFTIPTREQWIIDGEIGGSFISQSGTTRVDINSGAFIGVRDFILTEVPVSEPSTILKPTGHSFVLDSYQSNQSDISTLLQVETTQSSPIAAHSVLTVPLTITVFYTDTEIINLDESSLGLYHWDDQFSSWIPISTILEVDNNKAVGNSDVFGLYALLINDNDLQGPSIDQPMFDLTIPYNEWLTVTVPISDSLTGNHGVDHAKLYFGYTAPYTQTVISGISPGTSGDGIWIFGIPPQGESYEEKKLRFRIEAGDGDLSPVISINDNNGNYYTVTIVTPEYKNIIFLPLTLRNP